MRDWLFGGCLAAVFLGLAVPAPIRPAGPAAWELAAVFAGIVVLVLLLRLVLHTLNRAFQRDELLEWLCANEVDIRMGGVMRQGLRVTPATEVVRYRTVVGYLLSHSTSDTNQHLAGTGTARLVASGSTLVTALLGWWSLPLGPFEASAALLHNLLGGERSDVATLLEPVAAAAETSLAGGVG